jgi:UDP-N-acetylmuramate dehydrogenase
MTDLITRLPEVRGDYAIQDTMSSHTWFGVGGPADVIFSPLDEDDLSYFLAHCDSDIPILPIGAGSNLLVRDGGVSGVIIKLTDHMKHIHHEDTVVTAQTGALDAELHAMRQKQDWQDLSF